MVTAMFDTLSYSKKLQAAGVSQQAADAQAEALSEVLDQKLSSDIQEIKNDVSTLKEDITNIKGEIVIIKKDMSNLEERLNSRFERITFQLTIRMGTIMGAGIMLLGVVMKLV